MTSSEGSGVLSSNVGSYATGGTLATVEYAGFWRRFVALIVDAILLAIVNGIISAVLGNVAGSGGASIAAILSIIINWGYFSYMESSTSQATLGKMLLGIKVTDLDGNRISFGKALLRTVAKILSSVILLIGYIMAAFTAKKQALHDMIAGTLVVKGKAGA